MKCIIRIRGKVGINKKVEETLRRLNLKKKYSCIVINLKKEQEGMLKKIERFVAYGEISKEMLKEIIEKRGKMKDNKKLDAGIISGEIEKGKTMKDAGLLPFFNLHPPRGGIKSKLGYPEGALGNHKKEINKLIKRML
jgi:large subunit ribosomal protein L30